MFIVRCHPGKRVVHNHYHALDPHRWCNKAFGSVCGKFMYMSFIHCHDSLFFLFQLIDHRPSSITANVCP